MKDINFTKLRLAGVLSALMLLVASTTSCIRESLDACPPLNSYTLTLKVVNAEGDDITESGDVDEVRLFIFDKNKGFVDKRDMTLSDITSRQPITLDYPGDPENLYVVAWSGLTDGQVEVADVNNGSLAEDLNVSLRSSDGIAEAPNELYHGMTFVERAENALTKDQEVVITPQIGRITIEAYGLEYVNLLKSGNEDDFAYTVDKTQSAFNYQGDMTGDSVSYIPPAAFVNDPDNGRVFKVERYNIAPRADEGMSVSLYVPNQTKSFNLRANIAGTYFANTDEDDAGDKIVIPKTEHKRVVFIFRRPDDPAPDDPDEPVTPDPDEPVNPDPDDPVNPDDPDGPDDPVNPGPPPTPQPTPDPNIVVYVYVKNVDWNYVHEDHIMNGGEEVLKSNRKLK